MSGNGDQNLLDLSETAINQLKKNWDCISATW